MITKKFFLLLLSSISIVLCFGQSSRIQLKYSIPKSIIKEVCFPVQAGREITKYVSGENIIYDTLIIYINTTLFAKNDTLKNGTIIVEGVRYKNYFYRRRCFSHIYYTTVEIGKVKFIRLIVASQNYIFKKISSNKFMLTDYYVIKDIKISEGSNGIGY